MPQQHSAPYRSPFEPRPLQPADLDRLRLDMHPRLTHAEALDVLSQSPGASFWIPAAEEFVIVAPWRHRSELSSVHSFGAFGHEDALLRAAMEHAESYGQAGFVLVDINEIRSDAFYRKHRLVPFEHIVTYALRDARARDFPPRRRDVTFLQVRTEDPKAMRQLMYLDHEAFPWFWWNSDEEFAAYLAYPGVEVWAMTFEGTMIAYAGVTRYRRWGHLDRIAVSPSLQGGGFGYEILAFAVRTMLASGARSVALSTQEQNTRSRRLYERVGFVHTPKDDYGLHVRSFNDELVYAGMGAVAPARLTVAPPEPVTQPVQSRATADA